MKSRRIKEFYYSTVSKLSVVSLWWQRLFRKSAYRGAIVQLGCGANYIPGMVNIDGNLFRKKDLWLDVTLGLPFEDNSLSGIYASHILEHFETPVMKSVLRECYRTLRPEGRLRIVVPSVEFAINAWLRKSYSDFPNFPEAFSSIGGRFCNYLMCQGEHRLILDFSFLEELLQETGFAGVERQRPHQSLHFTKEHLQFEHPHSFRPEDYYLHVECVKP